MGMIAEDLEEIVQSSLVARKTREAIYVHQYERTPNSTSTFKRRCAEEADVATRIWLEHIYNVFDAEIMANARIPSTLHVEVVGLLIELRNKVMGAG